MKNTEFIENFLREIAEIARQIDRRALRRIIRLLAEVRSHSGRLFILGVGGSAANASHAVNDFRKIAGIESYAPTDNVSELTARVNDDGWETVFANWLRVSQLSANDAVLVLSVGGGDVENHVSPNLVAALDFARETGAKTLGIAGRDGGYLAKVADACVVVPTVNPELITPYTEAFQAVIWHLLVSHPSLKLMQTRWESIDGRSSKMTG